MCRRWPHRAVVSLQMDADHLVPFFFGHVEDHSISQDAGDVDKNIQLAEFPNRVINDALYQMTYGNGLVDAIRTAGLFNIIGRKADSPTRCRERALPRTAERMLPWGDELSSLTRPADDRVLEDAD